MSKPQGTSKRKWQEEARKKIQTSQILNRLIKHTLSDEDIMSTSQVNAARVLINKTLPDLKSIELTGENGEAIQVEVTSALLDKINNQLNGKRTKSK